MRTTGLVCEREKQSNSCDASEENRRMRSPTTAFRFYVLVFSSISDPSRVGKDKVNPLPIAARISVRIAAVILLRRMSRASRISIVGALFCSSISSVAMLIQMLSLHSLRVSEYVLMLIGKSSILSVRNSLISLAIPHSKMLMSCSALLGFIIALRSAVYWVTTVFGPWQRGNLGVQGRRREDLGCGEKKGGNVFKELEFMWCFAALQYH